MPKRAYGYDYERCRAPNCGEYVWVYSNRTPYCSRHRAERSNKKKRARELHDPGRTMSPDGYIMVADGYGGKAGEHRVVMEGILDRRLKPGESVHHRNGDRADNRPENLELWASSHPFGQRANELVCPHCGVVYYKNDH